MLALVALFTGGFLVFSAQALEVARRRGEHALLRVLGLERAGLARLVLAEAAAVGAAGAALGLALGYAFAILAVRASGGDLGAGMFRGLAPQVAFAPGAALAYLAAGIAVAVAGAWLPALDAARTPPAQALKAGDEQRLFARAVSLKPSAVLLAAALRARVPAAGGRAAARRLCGHRLPAGGRSPADAEAVAEGVRRLAVSAGARPPCSPARSCAARLDRRW